MPGTTSSSPSTGSTFFQLGMTAWMRRASRPHVGHHLAGNENSRRVEGLNLIAAPGVAKNKLAVELDHKHADRNRYERGGEPSSRQRPFCLGDSGVAEVRRIMRFFPNAVVYGGALGISNLVPEKAFGRSRGLLASWWCGYCQTSVEAKCSRGHGRRQNNISSRYGRHFRPP